MAKKSPALQRLLERNFGDSQAKSGSILKKKSKAEKRARHKRREEIKRLKEAQEPAKVAAPPPKNSELSAEIQALREEIAREIDTKPTYVKRQYRAEALPSWEGLTPGLAPVGYDPDESDEDPY